MTPASRKASRKASSRKPPPTPPAPLRIATPEREHPAPPVAIPEPPAELGPEALEEWGRITAQLAALGSITHLDRSALAIYCDAWATWRNATRELEAIGRIIKSPSGYPVLNPWQTVANSAWKTMQALLPQFGLTPAGRAALLVPAGGQADTVCGEGPLAKDVRRSGLSYR
jgi:P27 family predicted phage terminase small subunit